MSQIVSVRSARFVEGLLRASVALAAMAVACASEHHDASDARDAGMPATPASEQTPSQPDTRPAMIPGIPLSTRTGPCATSQLMAAPILTLMTPDATPRRMKLVSSASGALALAVWTDGGIVINDRTIPEVVWATTVVLGSDEVSGAAALQLAEDASCPAAAATADGFAMVWADAAGLQLQHLDGAGAARGRPVQVTALAGPRACPSSLLETNAGLVVGWYEPGSTNQSVALLDVSGRIVTKIVIEQVPTTASPELFLAVLHDTTYVAHVRWSDNLSDAVVSAIDWSTGAVRELGTMDGYLAAFIVTGDQLIVGLWGPEYFALNPNTADDPVQVWKQAKGDRAAAADSCGRVVALGHGGWNPGGSATGFFAEAVDPVAAQVPLGSMSEAALAGVGSRFAVLWYARLGTNFSASGGATPGGGTLNFTTLNWQ